MEKIGKHYYNDGDRVTWEDTFIDESDDIRAKIYGIEFDIKWIWNKLVFSAKTLFYMSKGFFD